MPFAFDENGEPANEETRRLREKDPGRFFMLRPSLPFRLPPDRQEYVTLAAINGRLPDDLTARERMLFDRIREESEWAASQGFIVEPDPDMGS